MTIHKSELKTLQDFYNLEYYIYFNKPFSLLSDNDLEFLYNLRQYKGYKLRVEMDNFKKSIENTSLFFIGVTKTIQHFIKKTLEIYKFEKEKKYIEKITNRKQK